MNPEENPKPESSLSNAVYDGIAEKYIARVDSSPYNTLYERPAMLSMLPPLKGLTILDAGCGSGWYAQYYLDHQANRVVCVDASEKMAAAARERVGPRARVIVADLSKPLDYAADEEFDLVAAPLSLHYLENWQPTLREFWRIIKPHGVLLFSTHHPCMVQKLFKLPDYFATVLIEDEWSSGPVRYYHNSLSNISAALEKADFVIERLLEPQPIGEMELTYPEDYIKLMHNPWFLVVRARKTKKS